MKTRQTRAKNMGRALVASLVLSAIQPAIAAHNCISNGDFEQPAAGYSINNHYAYATDTAHGCPTGWTLSPAGHTGLWDACMDFRFKSAAASLMGHYSLFLERTKTDTATIEARQSFTILAPGTYRLSLNSCIWQPGQNYLPVRATAQLIEPGGSPANDLMSFTPEWCDSADLKYIKLCAVTSHVLRAYGAGNAYTLRFYVTDAGTVDWSYNIIDNVNFSLHTLVLGANETYSYVPGIEPYDIELGANSTLTYKPSAGIDNVPGTVTFASGAKIAFDMTDGGDSYVFSVGGVVLPAGADDIGDFFEFAAGTGGENYAMTVRNGGREVVMTKLTARYAVWTGAAGDGNALTAGNWQDTDTGASVVPGQDYNVTIAGESVNLQIPSGSAFSCKSFDIGNCTFTTNCDWRGLSVRPTISGTANLNGHTLTLNNLAAAVGGTFTGTDGSALIFPVGDTSYEAFGESAYIEDVANLTLSGSVKIVLPKEGAGTFSSTTELNIGTVAGLDVEFKQTDGTVSLAIGRISQVAGAKATYTMTNGTLTASKEFEVGGRGVGEFIQTGGTTTLDNWLNIGRYGGTGIVTVNGGRLVNTVDWTVYVGAEGGTGIINVGGDGYLEVYNLQVGAWNSNNNRGYINISGNGHLKTRNWAALCNYNGNSGMYGEVNQSGGTFEVTDGFCVGERSSGVGVYNMTGGSLSVSKIMRIGWNNGSRGTFTQNDGTVTVGEKIIVAPNAGSSGTYVMNGGTIIAPSIEGGSGTSVFSANGGTIKASADGAILNNVGSIVFGNGTAIDSDGHSVSIAGCGYGDVVPGSSFVKTGAGTLAVDAIPPADRFVVSNGVLALSAAAGSSGTASVGLAHRWSFNGTAEDEQLSDSVGHAPNATKFGEALTFENGTVKMTGAGEGVGSLNLGSNLIPNGDVTFEFWAKNDVATSYSPVFEYGTGPESELMLVWQRNTGTQASVYVYTALNTDTHLFMNNMFPLGEMLHIVARVVERGGLYNVDVIRRQAENPSVAPEVYTYVAPEGWTPAAIAGSNSKFYLGKSFYAGDKDANATYDEVRIWNGALSDKMIKRSFEKGADATEADIADILNADNDGPVCGTIDLAGGTLDLGGNALAQPNLMGNGGTVRNGTLTVTDTIRLNVGDCITASGTVNLTNAKVEIVDVENLTKPFFFIKPATGAQLTLNGTPTLVDAPTGWRISVSSSGAKVTKGGFTIIVR